MKQNLEMYNAPLPSGQKEYMMHYGEHFSKKAAEVAIKGMYKVSSDGKKEPVKALSKEEVDALMSKYGIGLENDKGYDKVYVAAMCMADYYGTSITDEIHMARFIRDYLDDKDGYEGRAFTEWYHKVLHTGTPVMWEDIM